MPTERSWFATATTSAPEAEPEAKLHEALPDFIKDRTALISAHRLSAVKQADHVYVLDNGQIIEEGVYEELIKGEGLSPVVWPTATLAACRNHVSQFAPWTLMQA